MGSGFSAAWCSEKGGVPLSPVKCSGILKGDRILNSTRPTTAWLTSQGGGSSIRRHPVQTGFLHPPDHRLASEPGGGGPIHPQP